MFCTQPKAEKMLESVNIYSEKSERTGLTQGHELLSVAVND